MKIENIYEGVRFGNVEIQELKKESNKILIGIEYEYLPNNAPDPGMEYDTVRDRIEEEMRDYLAMVERDFISDRVDENNLDMAIEDLNFLVNQNMNELDFGKYSDPTSLTMEDLENLKTDRDLIKNMLERDGLDYWPFGSSNFNDVLTDIKRAIRHKDTDDINYPSFKEGYEATLKDINAVIAVIESGGIGELDSDIMEFTVTIGNLLDQYGPVMRNTGEKQMLGQISKIAYEFGDNEELAHMAWGHSFDTELQNRLHDVIDPDTINGNIDEEKFRMQDFGIDTSKIEKYHTEHNNMVEFITEPMPMLKAIDYMKEMFKYIKKNGSTPSFAGMHVNISIRGKSFLKSNFDILKLFLLLDQKFISEGDKYEKFLGFAPRNMVQKVLNPRHIPFGSLIHLAKSKNPDELISRVKEYIDVDKKYQQLNFNHIFNEENVELHRVEARYFGGEDYHLRAEEIEWQIYRLAYMLEIAFNPEFEREEYLKKLIKFLDEVSIHHTKVSFAEFSRQVVAGTVEKPKDVVMPSDINTRGEKSILIKQQNKGWNKTANEKWLEFKADQK